MTRIFLDANILFSAALPKSRMRGFLLLVMKKAVCVTNEYAAEEARRNIQRKAPDSLKRLDALLKQCELCSSVLVSFDRRRVHIQDKDVPILGGAVAAGATYLLTGDKRDFGSLWGKEVRGVRIVSPAVLADEIL